MKLQEFKKFATPRITQAVRTQLVLPAFTLPVSVWAGASVIIAEYAINNTNNFGIKLPVDEFGTDFVPAIRWVDGDVVFRFLFFSNDSMVLFYPIYDGEVIGPDAVIEIWSVNSGGAPTLSADEILESSVLIFPNNCGVCCAQPSGSQLLTFKEPSIISPYAYCDPFCVPLQVF